MKHWNDTTHNEKIARWEQVLRVLRSMTRHERERHFNMSFYGQKTSCGTVACAAGHCGLDPWFRRRGFKMDFRLLKSYYGRYFWDDDISDVEGFFGTRGFEAIFFDSRPRTVGKVIREVLSHIKYLKAEKEMV